MADEETGAPGVTPDVPPDAPPAESTSDTGPQARVISSFHDAFTAGDVTVTRDWTPIPSDQVESIVESARKLGVQVEVITE